MNVNNGHRARLRERMMKEGLSGFQDHEILELLLFQSLPRKDTNKLAHTLLNKFGDLAGVLNATPQQLMVVEGVSEVTACNLAVLKEVWLRYKYSEQKKRSLKSLSDMIRYSREIMMDAYAEKLFAVYVDNETKFVYQEEFTSDSTQYVNLDSKNIVTTSMRVGAAGVILFHCHVNGMCEPSDDDIRFTERLYFALASLDVMLLEHIIFNSSGDFYSFYQHNIMQQFAQKYKQLCTKCLGVGNFSDYDGDDD